MTQTPVMMPHKATNDIEILLFQPCTRDILGDDLEQG